jgi:hypothetical protein
MGTTGDSFALAFVARLVTGLRSPSHELSAPPRSPHFLATALSFESRVSQGAVVSLFARPGLDL